MSKQQWTVLGLLAALLGLEIVRSPTVRGFFTGALTTFQNALNQASIGPAPTGSIGGSAGFSITNYLPTRNPPTNKQGSTPISTSTPSSYPTTKGPR